MENFASPSSNSKIEKKAGKTFEIREDRFRKNQPSDIIGEIIPASIGEARGCAEYISDKSKDLNIKSLKDNYYTIRSWCQKEGIFSNRISEINTEFKKYKNMGFVYNEKILRQEAFNFAKEVLDHISKQNPRSSDKGPIRCSNKVTSEAREAAHEVQQKLEEMSANDLSICFYATKTWCENNDSLLRKYLANDEAKEIDTISDRINSLFKKYYNTANVPSEDIDKIRANILEYTKKVEALTYFADVWRVGKDKPMGSIPIATIEYFKNTRTLEQIIEDSKNRGLQVLIKHKIYKEFNGAIHVYDYKALEDLLQEKTAILKEAGWPADPDTFVHRVASERVSGKTKLYNVIADAFADYTNPARMNITASMKESALE